jgi:hypothetical protein
LCFGRLEQVSRLNAESRGETNDVSQAYVPFTALHAADVSAMYPGLGRKGFLTQPGSLA